MIPRLALAVLVLAACPLTAQPPAAKPVAAKSVAFAGAVSRPTGPGTYEVVPAGADLTADELLVMLPGAGFISVGGTVKVTSRADLTGLSPVFETAVIPHAFDPAKVDAEFTLDRGRIDILNVGKGSAAVAVRVRDRRWRVTLDQAGTRVAVELSGRWPTGTDYQPKPPAAHAPVFSAVAVVLNGSADISDGVTTLHLTAPPGPAMVTWTSASAAPPVAVKLASPPAWTLDRPALTPAQRLAAEAAVVALEKFRSLQAARPAAAIEEMLASPRPEDRLIGLIEAGAHDDLPRLTTAIAEVKDAAVWDAGVSVLRHWLGRGAGQDAKLVAFLTASRGYTPTQAALVVRLLNGFTPAEAARPETYEVLIEYLRHDQSAVRTLAAWHLVRLAPAVGAGTFAPNAGKPESEVLYKRWKDAIPSGRLPPRLK